MQPTPELRRYYRVGKEDTPSIVAADRLARTLDPPDDLLSELERDLDHSEGE